MRDLSLHLLDLAQNSVKAGASLVTIRLTVEESGWLTLVLADDGCGMDEALLARVKSPFATTRTTRKVGLGLPLYRLTAEQTGGSLQVRSTPGGGTTVTAVFDLRHLDCPPLGNISGTIALLVQGSPDIDIAYWHTTPKGTVELSTREMRQLLGPEVSLAEPEVFSWLNDYLSEHEAQLEGAEQG